jgi:hypothetical protein
LVNVLKTWLKKAKSNFSDSKTLNSLIVGICIALRPLDLQILIAYVEISIPKTEV